MAIELAEPPSDEFRPVKGWEGFFSVSNDGRVYSHPRMARIGFGKQRRKPGAFMKPVLDKFGYFKVTLRMGDKRKDFFVHRLVALAWIESTKDVSVLDVNHKDGNPKNCHVDNLEWCTRSENIRHAWRTGLRVQTPAMKANSIQMGRSNRSLSTSQAQEVRSVAASGKSITAIASSFNLSRAAIYKIINGESYQQNGETK